jgi:hypothetical protein
MLFLPLNSIEAEREEDQVYSQRATSYDVVNDVTHRIQAIHFHFICG